MEQLSLGEIIIEVEIKDIKNIHLSVYPPTGRVRIAAPLRMTLDTIRIYALSKLAWIKKQQQKFASQVREGPREYLNRESHYYLGKRYLLRIVERDAAPAVKVKHNVIELQIRPGSGFDKKQTLMEHWYRLQLKQLATDLISKWGKIMGVSPNEVCIKKMKIKWGTCNTEAKRIWLNLELTKKPLHCIEYIIVHEMVHLLERSHNDRFVAYMNRFLPEWRHLKNELNQLPISHTEWGY